MIDGIVVCTIDVCISFPATLIDDDGSVGVKVVGLSSEVVAVVSREL